MEQTKYGYGDIQTWGGRTPYQVAEEIWQESLDEEQHRQEQDMLDFYPDDMQEVFDTMTEDERMIFAKQAMLQACKNSTFYKEFWNAFRRTARNRAEAILLKHDQMG